MKPIAINIAVASIGLGFASPFIAVLVVPTDETADRSLLYQWFYGFPAEVLAMAPWDDANALVASIGIFTIQYMLLFTALVGMVALVKWTFSSASSES